MKVTRMASLVVGTVAVAMSIGFAMQTYVANEGNVARAGSASILASLPSDFVARNNHDLTSGSLLPKARLSRMMSDPSCKLSVRAVPVADASAHLSIQAPCFPDTQVRVQHSKLEFTALTGADGKLEVIIPVLQQQASFTIKIAGGLNSIAVTDVPDAGNWTRVALQWQGANDLSMHAREFGAEPGAPGHVWADHPGNPSTGSTLLRLGDGKGERPLTAEIYSFPRAMGLTGLVTLTAQASVTPENCGQDVLAEVIDLRGQDRVFTRQLAVTMPDCTAVGNVLVLNNLTEGLKIAAK